MVYFYFSDFLAIGRTKYWPEVLKEFTGYDKMTAKPMLEYFKNVYDWVVKDNEKHGEFIGWEDGKLSISPFHYYFIVF